MDSNQNRAAFKQSGSHRNTNSLVSNGARTQICPAYFPSAGLPFPLDQPPPPLSKNAAVFTQLTQTYPPQPSFHSIDNSSQWNYPTRQHSPISSNTPSPNQVIYNTGYHNRFNGPSESTPYPASHPPTEGPPTAGGRRPPQAVYPDTPNRLLNPYSIDPSMDRITNQMNSLSVAQPDFNKRWENEQVNFQQLRHILPAQVEEPPQIRPNRERLNDVPSKSDIFRCTLTKIPQSNSILQESRLPLGLLMHPFKDQNQLPTVQSQKIARCNSCGAYINPFVFLFDHGWWKCNLCFNVNRLPAEFQNDPIKKMNIDISQRPEMRSAMIEYIVPHGYKTLAPKPPVYLYLLDVSHDAVQSGYLKLFTDILSEELDNLLGDARTQIGFITYDSRVHFYNLAASLKRPQQIIVTDIDDIYLPLPSGLLVELNGNKRLVIELLRHLDQRFTDTLESHSALGAALQAADELIGPTGGRITVFQANMPNIGPGALKVRAYRHQRALEEVSNLNPLTDFYKKFGLDCSTKNIAVDLFLLGGQDMDIASMYYVSKYSGGCINHFPNLHHVHNTLQAERLKHTLRRYLTRRIGFQSVMRIRCTQGLSIRTFHGNCYVNKNNLLNLSNINPDAGFGLQVYVDENLVDIQNVCFQAALVYTSSEGEQRVRVHTMCVPIADNVAEVIKSADQQCIIGLLAKMAVDRALSSSITDARHALIKTCADVITSYKATLDSKASYHLVPGNLRLLPLYVAALLKSAPLRIERSTRLNDRFYVMNQLKVLPLPQLMQSIYPDLYAVHNLNDQGAVSEEGKVIPQPPRLHLSTEMVRTEGAYMMDTGDVIYLYVGKNICPVILSALFGSPDYSALPEQMYKLPELATRESERLRNFYQHLQNKKSQPAVLQLIKYDSKIRHLFVNYLVDDRTESSPSYHEFLQNLNTLIR